VKRTAADEGVVLLLFRSAGKRLVSAIGNARANTSESTGRGDFCAWSSVRSKIQRRMQALLAVLAVSNAYADRVNSARRAVGPMQTSPQMAYG
jgi:hypothetical protein